MLLDGKRIFVVEDDSSNLAIIRTILLRQGASVPFDVWGSGTIDILRNSLPIDLILLDLALPRGVSGYDVFDQIRVTPELAKIPVVIVTAADPSTEMVKARTKGVNGFISKPIKYGSFAQSVASVLRGEAVWDDGSM
jgi:CheY-like chemotaxis protein